MDFGKGTESPLDKIVSKISNQLTLFGLQNGFKATNFNENGIEFINDDLIITVKIEERKKKQSHPAITPQKLT